MTTIPGFQNAHDIRRLEAEVKHLSTLVEQLAEMTEHAVLVVHGPNSTEAASIRNLLAKRRK